MTIQAQDATVAAMAQHEAWIKRHGLKRVSSELIKAAILVDEIAAHRENDAKDFVGEGNRVLAQISGAAAELLGSAHEAGSFGVELGGLFDKETARELESEGFGEVRTECEAHGMAPGARLSCQCGAGEFYSIFVINDAGTEWLEDAGRI